MKAVAAQHCRIALAAMLVDHANAIPVLRPRAVLARQPLKASVLLGSAVGQLIKQRPSLFQIDRVEALGKPSIDRHEQITRLNMFALFAPQTCEAGGGAN